MPPPAAGGQTGQRAEGQGAASHRAAAESSAGRAAAAAAFRSPLPLRASTRPGAARAGRPPRRPSRRCPSKAERVPQACAASLLWMSSGVLRGGTVAGASASGWLPGVASGGIKGSAGRKSARLTLELQLLGGPEAGLQGRSCRARTYGRLGSATCGCRPRMVHLSALHCRQAGARLLIDVAYCMHGPVTWLQDSSAALCTSVLNACTTGTQE